MARLRMKSPQPRDSIRKEEKILGIGESMASSEGACREVDPEKKWKNPSARKGPSQGG